MLAAEANIPQLGLTSIQTTTTIPESVLSDDLAAAFNDDNDDFFADIPINSIQHSNQNSINQRSFAINVNIHPNECLNDSLSAVFQDVNDFGDDYVWGSAAKNTRVSATPNVEPSVKRTKNGSSEMQYNYAWGSSETPEIPCDEANIKCSGCHMTAKKCVNTTLYPFLSLYIIFKHFRLSVKKEGPNKGRQFYVCPKSNSCTFFQWADEINTNQYGIEQNNVRSASSGRYGREFHDESRSMRATDEIAENCNCNQPAKSLLVRKEGPNKGRGFYACANREKSCGFFKWTDEAEGIFTYYNLLKQYE